MDQVKKSGGAESPGGVSQRSMSAVSVTSTDSVAAVSLHDKNAIAIPNADKENEKHMASNKISGVPEQSPLTVDAQQDTVGSETVTADPSVISTPGTVGAPSDTVTPEGGGTPGSRGSSSRTSIESAEGSSQNKKPRRKKRRRKREGRREPVTVVSRSNIIRDPLYVCLGQSFPSDDDVGNAASAPEADPKRATIAGADNVVAYVTTTNIDGPGLSSASTAATVDKTVEEAELVKEKAVLTAVLNDLIECLELHSSNYDKSEGNGREQGNGLVDHRSKLAGASPMRKAKRQRSPRDTSRKKRGGREELRLDFPTGEASSPQLQRLRTPVERQAVEPHSQHAVACREKAPNSPVTSTYLKNKEEDCVIEKDPAGAAAVTELGHVDNKQHEGSQDIVGLAERKLYEAPLVFFSMSRTESSERNQIVPSKRSSGYAAGSETTEPFVSKRDDEDDDEEDRGCLDMAFGADSFTEDLEIVEMGRISAPSPNTVSAIQGCWHDFLAPIKMVSKYIQTECWNEPETESSFSEVVRKHRSTSTKTLKGACSLQITVPDSHATAAGGLRSEESSVEELTKIFAAYSSSPVAHMGKDEFGRADVKGVVRDRNFGVPSPMAGGGTTIASPPTSVVAQGCTCDGGSSPAGLVYNSAAEE